LAYLPFAPEAAAQIRRARLKGHPVMLHLPMEAPDHGGKPGVNVLSVASSPEKLRRQLTDILGRFGGYTGVNNHMGSKFTRNRAKMDIVISELRKRGLFFLDSRTSGGSMGAAAAAAAAADAGIPYAVRDVFLDHEADPEKIRAQIAETERIARATGQPGNRATGQAIAIGHPRTATMKAIAPWVAGLKERGFELVRLDALLKRNIGKKLAQARTGE
ncbi:MAG: divergent polysaccharide deacetylase family protein, partial [Rhodospirillaceae bacterium]|nr:divergent polysaccharide deacetylase family protein [Rhodospirillaceae bacterium]